MKEVEEMDCENFFEQQFDDFLLEFPDEDFDNVCPSTHEEDFPAHSGYVGAGFSANDGSNGIISTTGATTSSDLAGELSVPYEDIAQLEWLSAFVEDSFYGGGMTIETADNTSSFITKDFSKTQSRTASSPVSVLESSSTSCSTAKKTVPLIHQKRARSKRPRPVAFNSRAPMPLSSIVDNSPSLQVQNNYSLSRPLIKKVFRPVKGVQKKRTTSETKCLPPPTAIPQPNPTNKKIDANPSSQAAAVRKCLHCEITKTPQWRVGPLGPKTLCNACGVRYKSGRLFPEYRPAASPTFVPLLHSNSHRKVLEMRSRDIVLKPEACAGKATAAPKVIPAAPVSSLQPAACSLS